MKLIQTWTLFLVIASVWALVGCTDHEMEARCSAAKATVIAESDMIAAAGKFPNEATVLRWEALTLGCE